MLELKNIVKDYIVGGEPVHALKGVDLAFRESEFVSVLGPSGCGKTTLLNIIGGLDHYTNGELFIDGVSTKNYTDRDWDTYRNHRIGFVFQSYNLIPHQSVSENVELALNISGVDRAERIRRAHEALDKVGLAGQYNKKPNQLSGGQCQRVAIARALVNNPEILLADEPTGALDSETSVQIMDLISEISKECLVIMVTHNPELAEKYSTRIIKLLDGEVISDSDPYTAGDPDTSRAVAADDVIEQKTNTNVPKKKQPTKKAKLSFWSAFKLSAKNLLSKIKRTVLVCFAGSIGIIGVATVLAVSSGVQDYIHDMQDDMLSGNPVTISSETYDLNAMIGSAGMGAAAGAMRDSVEDGYVNADKMIENLINNTGDDMRITNDITQEYVDFVKEMPEEYYAAIAAYYGINLSNNLYTDFVYENGTRRTSLSAATQTYLSMLAKTEYADFAKYIGLVSSSFKQAPDNPDFILSQYDIISDPATSKVATAADEIMIVVNEDTALTDLMLAQFGYYTQAEFFNLCYRTENEDRFDESLWKDKFTYDELLGKRFTYYPNDTVFNKTTGQTAAINPFTYNAYEGEDWTGGIDLKITAILRPKKEISFGCLSRGFYYTGALVDEILRRNAESEIVKYMSELEGEDKSITSMAVSNNNMPTMYYGITYGYDFRFEGADYTETGLVGTQASLNAIFGSMMGQELPDYYTLTLREVGGINVPNSISIFPTNFDYKDNVTAYISQWNEDKDLTVGGVTIPKDKRSDVIYADNLAIVIGLINDMIEIVTIALVAFTALSLVVSTVMIAIITYVSVIERIKEIGVIRSLGGRKRDVSALFNAETFIIGGISGVIGVAVTYVIQVILNLALGAAFGVYTIAALPVTTALIMVALSILLTLVSGLIPARLAAKKDPVDALRSE